MATHLQPQCASELGSSRLNALEKYKIMLRASSGIRASLSAVVEWLSKKIFLTKTPNFP